MSRSSRRLLLALTALLALAGCQLTEIEKAICEIGETKCKDDQQLECRANESGKADWIVTDKNCASTCQEGETKCIAGNIYACDTEGNWHDTPTTECGNSGCSEGSIQPANEPLSCYECGNDEARCENNTLIVCSDHRLSKATCDNGCVKTETDAYCRECKDNEFKCEKDFIVSCANDGERKGKWDDDHKQRCEHGCFPGTRGNADAVKCYECNTGKRECVTDEKTGVVTIKQCLAHTWYDDETCDMGCVEGPEAECKLCNSGDKKYYNNDMSHCVEQECKDNQYLNTNTAEVSCNSDLSGLGECLNGTPKCENNNLKICTAGAWRNYGNCNSEDPCALLANKDCYDSLVGIRCENNQLLACDNNASCKPSGESNLICANCQNETSICSKNIVLRCQNGEYQQIDECHAGSPGTHCEEKDGIAQCVKHDCENGQQRCSEDGSVQTCKDYTWKTTSACADGYRCYQSGNKADCGCSNIDDTCADYEVCKNGVCQRKSCTEDSSICNGNKCKKGECYDDNNNIAFCDDRRVTELWWKHYDIIDRIIHPEGKDYCETYDLLKEVTNSEGTALCNQINICGNPNTIENCITNVIFLVIAGAQLPAGYEGKLDSSHMVRAVNFLSISRSTCARNCIDNPSICNEKYQLCNSKGECVPKPCSHYKDVCGDNTCENDTCLPQCEPNGSNCASEFSQFIIHCEDNLLRTEICAVNEYCVEEGGKAQCVLDEED